MINIDVVNTCGTNSYIISNKEAAIIVDPGGYQNAEQIFLNVISKGLRSILKLIVITHGHYDHTEGTCYLKGKFRIPILMHRNDIILLGKTKYQLHARTWIGKFGKILMNQPKYVEYFEPDIIIEDEYLLDNWGINGNIIPTPGHTKGSISLICGTKLIAGDTFMNIMHPTETLFAEDFGTYDKTVTKLSKYHIIDIYPGHGKSFKHSKLSK